MIVLSFLRYDCNGRNCFLSAVCSGFYVGGVYFDDAVNEWI